jgi:hypothetical protein
MIAYSLARVRSARLQTVGTYQTTESKAITGIQEKGSKSLGELGKWVPY